MAASRYAEGKPIMSDSEFDALRRKLKAANSQVLQPPAVSQPVRGAAAFVHRHGGGECVADAPGNGRP